MKQKSVKNTIKQTIINLFVLMVFVLSIFLLVQVSDEIVATFQLRERLELVNEKLAIIELENQYLGQQKEKLLDPEYIKNYARASFMLSKEGEQIFFLPQRSKDE